MKKIIFVFVLLVICTPGLYAQPGGKQILDYQQVTTHPDIDLSARISPDGKWMTYVSRQSGNFDIWIRSTAGGRDIQVTFHKADDYYPVWSPDGRSIVFVSQRSDAEGDIWRVYLREVKGRLYPKDELERLTDYQGMDGYPTISPDGYKIAWVSDRTGREELWFYNARTENTLPLTFKGGTHPVWSPDQRFIAFTSFRDGQDNNGDIFVINLKGPRPSGIDTLLWDTREYPTWQVTKGPAIDGFPSWTPDAKNVTFLRMSYDTNRDGKLTPVDRASVWEAEVFEFPTDSLQAKDSMLEILEESFNIRMVRYAMPLTSGGENTMQPWSGANDRVYFTSDRGGNLDVWSFPSKGHIPQMQTPQEQFELAASAYPLTDRMTRQTLGSLFLYWDPSTMTNREQLLVWDRLLAFRRVIDFHNSMNPFAALAYYEMGVCLDLLDYPDRADRFLQLLLDNYPAERKISAYAEMALLGLKAKQADEKTRLDFLLSGLNNVIDTYNDQPEPAAAARIMIGDLLFRVNKDAQAFNEYKKVLEEYPQQRSECAESQLKIGDVFNRFATRAEVINAYLQVVIHYPEQRQWMVPARDRILDMLTMGVSREIELVGQYREIVGQYAQFPLLAAAAQQRIGDILYKNGDFASAIQEYEMIESLFPDLTDEVFTAQMSKANALLKMGEKLQAFNLLEQLYKKFESSRAELSQKAWDKLLASLLESGDELKLLQEFNLALLRYARAKEMAPDDLHAHRGYIECMYYLRKIGQAVIEYENLVRQYPEKQIILYSLGLAYSYQGTEKAELYNDPDALDKEILNRSSYTIARALAFDYTLVQPYLTISYNYEMMEQALARERAKPKSFFVKAWDMLKAPFESLYNTITFANVEPTRGYYERAIHELTKAIGLNDEEQDPALEANLALNLANNYYNLGEYGYEKAYEYYHVKLKYDSTFFDKKREAVIYERMGHCALIVEDLERGPEYLKYAIQLYQELEDETHVLLNINRLALLYQIGDVNEYAIEYFQMAAAIQKRKNMYDDLMRSYRSIAYNYLQLEEPNDAIIFARQALDLLETGKVKVVKSEASRVKLGFLGLYFPVPFLDLSKMGTGAALKFTTEDEKALVYSILGTSHSLEKNYSEAIDFFEKKREIYKKRKDYEAVATFLNNIGYLYFLKGDYSNSWSSFLESYEICKKREIIRGIIVNSTNLAKIVLSMNNAFQEGMLDYDSSGNDFKSYQNIAAEKINYALEVTGEEETRYARLKSILYRYLSEFSLISYKYGAEQNIQSDIISTMNILNNASFAQTYLEEALRISRQNNLINEECSVLYTLGKLFMLLHNTDNAYVNLINSRRLAIRNGFFDLLWRIDTDLGDLLATMDRTVKRKHSIQRDAYEFYNEAIDVMRAHPEDISGANAAMTRQAHQLPYRRAIKYLVDKGDYNGALAFSEQMRSNIYLDIVRGENIVLRKERHKIYYGNAKFLQNRINELEIELLRSRYQYDIPFTHIVEIRDQLENYKNEYQELLENTREEVPELETLVRANPIPVSAAQNRLRQDEAILYFTSQDEDVLCWLILPGNVEFSKIKLSRVTINLQIKSLFEAIKTGNTDDQSFQELFSLLSPLEKTQQRVNRLIIIPALDSILLPWSIFTQQIENQGSEPLSFVVCSSLTDYYYSYDKRKIQGNRIYFAAHLEPSDYLKQDGYTIMLPLTSQEQNSFSAQLQPLSMSDFLYLSVHGEWNDIDPARSRIGYTIRRSSPAVFSSLDLYRISLNANLVYLGFNSSIPRNKFSEPFIAWERAFRYAGVPAILINLWESNSEDNSEFLSVFYKNLKTNPAAKALSETQQFFKSKGKPESFWARFQLYGFGGMTREEEEKYAVEGFEIQVRRGHSAFDLSEWADAIRFYESAYHMAERHNDEQSVKLLQQRILESAVNGALWDKAIEIQLEQISKAQKQNNIAAVANGYSNLAYFYTQNGQFEMGVQAKAKYSQLAEQYGLKEEEAKSLRETGLIYERGGKYKEAVELFTIAKQKFSELDNQAGVAQCLRDIGRINFVYFDNYYDALVVQEDALIIFRRLGLTPDLVDALHNLGITCEKMTNYKQALQYQKEALQYSQQLGEKKLTGLSKQYLANIYWKMGEFQSALTNQNEALDIFTALNDEKLLQVGNATRGLIALSFGQPQKALSFELKALEMASNRGDQKDQATIYKNIGMIQRTMGRDDLALSSFEQAALIDSSIGSKSGLAYDYRNIATNYIEKGSSSLARNYCNRALALSGEIGDWRNQAQCYLELGRIEILDDNPDSAIVYFNKTADLSGQLFMSDIEWRAHKYLAEINRNTENIQQAVKHYYDALDVIENMRSRIKVEEYASGFVDDKADVYGALISSLLEQGQTGEALQLVERAKSRSFLDMLGNKNISFKSKNAELLSKGDSLQTHLAALQTQLFYIRTTADSLRQSRENELQEKIAALQDAYSAYLIKIREADPELGEMMTVEPWPVSEIQSILPDSTGLLEYYIYGNFLYSWFVTSQSVEYTKEEITEEELYQDIFDLRQALERQLSITKWSQKLYHHLISPWENQLTKIGNVVIIPQTKLHYLPFAVLQDNINEYFGLKYSLSIAPSATVFGFCMKKGDSLLSQSRRDMAVLAYGNPDLGDKNLALPFASREVNSLNRYYNRVNGYLEKRASETNLYDQNSYPPLIIFSCHGVYDDVNPLLSALMLAPDSSNDGRLEANEIFTLDLNAFIVAMSACETGLGTIRGGDEVVGLSRSFIYAGASSLLSSLWKVDDLATAVLVKRFFRNLAEGKSRTEALRLAQKVVYDEINPYPSFWGAFTITGDFR
ncbi:CHAT domain-containing protein [candidate division KSB1 bacterium]|nr:CHAT domain-containing protein [candidate division KSB1 bacterium]